VEPGVVIIGGGQGGYQAAASLRTEGYEGSIILVSEERHIPYQRPPLSKAFVLGKQDLDRVYLRPENYYPDHRIELLKGERVESIDRGASTVTLRSGGKLRYSSLILATGARNRTLPVPGGDLEGICYLRTVDESAEIKQRLETAQRVVVIGGGFIGLEIAATARVLGKEVTVLEALPRVMARAVAPVVSEYFEKSHREQGVNIHLDTQVTEISQGRVGFSPRGPSGPQITIQADLIVVGIGVIPNTDLARAAGLAVSNGFSVDEFLRTSDPNIFAIGDCAEFPHPQAQSRVRLESVQNAVDHAVAVARTITGKPAPYSAVPWFWSDQFDIRLQMAGLCTGFNQSVVRGAIDSRKFSVFYFRNEELLGVDSMNRPADHLAARKLLAARKRIAPEQAADESVNLKDL
jgi:3-phenylpropionate/trans-cinnamate dioxygenase ferredoxin reductase subunit